MVKKLSMIMFGVLVIGFCMATVLIDEAVATDIAVSGKHTTYSPRICDSSERGGSMGIVQKFGWPDYKDAYFNVTSSNTNYSVTLRNVTTRVKYAVVSLGERCTNAGTRVNISTPSSGTVYVRNLNY